MTLAHVSCSFMQCSGSGWIRVFSPIRIRPLIDLWDLNDGFDKVWRNLTKKDNVKSARYEI